MTITLTTPYDYNPGRGIPTITYGEVKIIGHSGIVEPPEDASLTLICQYGDVVDGVWVGGLANTEYITIIDTAAEFSIDRQKFVIDGDPESGENPTYGEWVESTPRGTEYRAWVASTYPSCLFEDAIDPADVTLDDLLYAEVGDAWYEWLITQEGFEGTL